MKERPILMHARSIKGILEGRKTQTRRIIKPQPVEIAATGIALGVPCCPYGQPGDRLWVRETLKLYDSTVWHYVADGREIELPTDSPNVPAMLAWAHHKEGEHCPSIHMPRWASRLTLEIADIRVERVQEISERDAVAEGAWHVEGPTAKLEFMRLWDETNGKGAWDRNDWVWAISFRRVA